MKSTGGLRIPSHRQRAHPDALRGASYRAAALYGMSPVTSFEDRPVGEWNSSRIVLRGKHVEHWLNGVKVVDTSLDAPAVRQAIEKRWHDAPASANCCWISRSHRARRAATPRRRRLVPQYQNPPAQLVTWG